MSHGLAAHQAPPAPGRRWETNPVPRWLRWGMHMLVAALLLIGVARSVVGQLPMWPWTVACSALVGAVYAMGAQWTTRVRTRSAAQTWCAALVVGWVPLLLLSPDAVYLAFPWFFLVLHLLPRAVGLLAVAVTTVVAVAGFAWHQKAFTAAMAIGPLLGAGVAIATVIGYQALMAESESRRRLIVELDRTRAELAAVEHQNGVRDERERLAREIHDTLAQGLSSIQLLLRAAGRSLDPAREVNSAKAAHLVEQARSAAQENLVEARRFVQALSPAELEHSTLSAALQRLCDTTSARLGLQVSFHETGKATPLTTPVEIALLRVAQAALANTGQHAGATRADVTLTIMDTEVTLDVVDDGIGFDLGGKLPPPLSPGHGGFGLRSMEARTAELGGEFTVESQPGRGTAVSVHFDRYAAARDGSIHVIPSATGQRQ